MPRPTLLPLIVAAAAALISLPATSGPQPLTGLMAPLWGDEAAVVVPATAEQVASLGALVTRAGARVATPPQGLALPRFEALVDAAVVTVPASALGKTSLEGTTVVIATQPSHAAFAASLAAPSPAPHWLTAVVGLVMALTGIEATRSRRALLQSAALLAVLVGASALGVVVALEAAALAWAVGLVGGMGLYGLRRDNSAESDARIYERLTRGSRPATEPAGPLQVQLPR